jgi:hypothetical protein
MSRRCFSSESASPVPAGAWSRCVRGSAGEGDERERYRRKVWMEMEARRTKARRAAMMRREGRRDVLEYDGGATGSAASVYGGGGDGKMDAIIRGKLSLGLI